MLPLDFILFLQIIIFMFITPGTPRIVIISYSMNYGVQKCVWTALGDVTANIIQATLVIFVIGSFLSDNPTILNTLKWLGIAYLTFLAYDIYKSRPKDINTKDISDKSFFWESPESGNCQRIRKQLYESLPAVTWLTVYRWASNCETCPEIQFAAFSMGRSIRPSLALL